MSTTAAGFKQAGNEFFKTGQFSRAIESYTKAEQADPTDPVYPSNLSAALYEAGKYDKCVSAILRAWALLHEKADTKADLVVRLSSRLAKALSLGTRAGAISQGDLDANQEAIEGLRKASEIASGSGVNPAAQEELLRMWQEWDATAPDVRTYSEEGRRSLARLSRMPLFSKPMDDVKEYYSIGNDTIINLLDGWGARTDPDRLDLNTLSHNQLSEVAFLFGGVGDGRHTLGTICGLHDAYKKLSHAKRSVFRTHLTMLDIHEAAIARDLCMLILIDHLIHASDATSRVEIKTTLMYMFLAPVMPSYCHDRLHAIMTDIRARLSSESPGLPAWMHLDDGAIPGILRTLDYWLSTPKSTRTMLSRHEHQNPEASRREMELIALKTGNVEFQRKLQESKAEQRRELEMSFRGMSDEMLKELPFVPPGMSAAEARALLDENMDVVLDTLEGSYNKGRIVGYEETWYEVAKVFLPPQEFLDRHDGFGAAWAQVKRATEVDKAALRKANSHIKKDWKVNITLFDANYNNAKYHPGGDGYPDLKYDAYEAVGYMADFNNRHDPTALDRACIGMNTLTYEVAGAFFEGVADAIRGLEGRITVELICGGLSEELAKMRFGGDVTRPPQFPRKYTRMWLSNVPDYTHGPMNMAIFILPNLQDHPQAAAACNCLLNTGVWANDDEYIHTYTHLPPKDISRYLGCRIIRPHAVMEILVMGTQPLPRPLTELATRDELTAWLSRVLFNTFVSGRSQLPPNNVRLPHNLVAFFGLLMHLHRVGFPAHWLSDFLGRMLSGRMLSDIAPYTGLWPIPVSDASRRVRPRQVRTDPWLVEFENIMATAYYGIPFAIATALPADFSRDPEDIRVWEAPVTGIIPFSMKGTIFNFTSPLEPTTRLLFYKPAAVIPAEVIANMKSIFEGKTSPPPGSFFVLTAQECVQYQSRVQLRLSRRRVERMRQEKWNMVVYRNDDGQEATKPVPIAQWVEVAGTTQ